MESDDSRNLQAGSAYLPIQDTRPAVEPESGAYKRRESGSFFPPNTFAPVQNQNGGPDTFH